MSFHPLTEGEVRAQVEVWVQGTAEPEVVIPMVGMGVKRAEGAGCASGGAEPGSSWAVVLALLALALARL